MRMLYWSRPWLHATPQLSLLLWWRLAFCFGLEMNQAIGERAYIICVVESVHLNIENIKPMQYAIETSNRISQLHPQPQHHYFPEQSWLPQLWSSFSTWMILAWSSSSTFFFSSDAFRGFLALKISSNSSSYVTKTNISFYLSPVRIGKACRATFVSGIKK